MLTRRTFVASALAVTAGCRRRKASGFPGYVFVANQEGQAVAAVDLTVFAVARHIRLSGRPTSILTHPRRTVVYALTPETGTVHEIRSDTLAFSRKLQVAASAVSMRISTEGDHLYVLCSDPRKLVRIALASFQSDWQVTLPGTPADFDVDVENKRIAISYGAERILSLITPDIKPGQPIRTTGDTGTVRFLRDGTQLITANLSDRMLSIYQVPSGRIMVNLPLAVRPDHMCFNSDGGQLFVTGEGGDAVVVVYPYYTPYIAETVLAGHAPAAMASTFSVPPAVPQYLFVANPKSGDVTILDITARRVIAVTPVGAEPGQILITPDDQYALVLNQGSGDMAVLRLANITRAVSDFRRFRKGPIFMMIPVGSKPVSAAILPM